VQPAHLEGLGTLEQVALAKGELFEGLPVGATAVVNLDDERVATQANRARGPRLTYGRHNRAQVRLVQSEGLQADGQQLAIRYAGREYPVRLAFLGEHNALNATGAFALALAMGWSAEECVSGLEAARAFERRLTLKPGLSGVRVLDDCYNANPASMAAALNTVAQLSEGGRAFAVLGDMLELGAAEAAEHARLAENAAKAVHAAAFFGPRGAHALAAAGAMATRARHFLDIEALLTWLLPQLQSGDIVLVKGSRGMRLERVVQALTGEKANEAH
jgi:UDP-N-acetylmuramoyl-tripeptide--D-alanyl-D-alanine ligase